MWLAVILKDLCAHCTVPFAQEAGKSQAFQTFVFRVMVATGSGLSDRYFAVVLLFWREDTSWAILIAESRVLFA